ncbi:histidine kinase [Polaribacter pacificus]|uniref:Histidine kinase n=1 Tax=Polaribacter pacificus TaxID=1775173 RepID=A0A917MF59_9FLAO|nr:2TM domain-containing protein [Polaribacter pacificus]GGH02760.1 histidine kinase [Polaribacter pacificus]
MTPTDKSSSKKRLTKDFWLCVKMTLIFGVIFVVINQQFTLEGVSTIFLFSALYSFSLGLGNGIINEYLNGKWDWVEETNQRVAAGIVATVVYTVSAVLANHYLMYVVILGYDSSLFFEGSLLQVHIFTIIFALAIAAFFHARGFMVNWKASMSQKSTKQEFVAKTETAKFESLKSQIDPHFLFNSLNVLTSLISENPKQAERFTTKLSKVYRYVLEQRNKELIPLEEELKFARTYMELLHMRFEDAIQFEIPTQASSDELRIVPLSLQLLLENAVKHNVVSSNKPLVLRIFEEDGFLIIENNVSPKEAIGKSTKVGLNNITDRYRLLTRRSVSIVNNQKTFKVSLPLLTKNNKPMFSEDIKTTSYVRAVEKVEKLKEFYQNLASYCIVIPFLIFINLYTSPGYHWFWFPLFGWGIGVIFHGLDVYNYNPFLGRNWENKKIKELMEEDDDTSNWE